MLYGIADTLYPVFNLISKGNIMQKKLLVAVLGTLFALPALADTTPATTAPAAAPAAAPEAAAAPTPAVTSNVALVSNYLYRGISQTGNNPAVQGGFDYAHSSGFYIGTWGSSISWISDGTQGPATSATTQTGAAGLELDTYLGFKNSFATDFSYDVGYLRYNYPGHYATGATKADTDELYALIGYKWVTLKLSDALGNTFGLPNSAGSTYIDLSASYAIGDSGFTVGAHVGQQTYAGSTASALKTAGQDPTYTDYKVSVTKDFSGYVVGLAYSSTNASSFYTNAQGAKLGQGTVVASLTRTF